MAIMLAALAALLGRVLPAGVTDLELVTGRDVQDRWGDVGARRLRDWSRPDRGRGQLLTPVTNGQLAGWLRVSLGADVDPAAPAKYKDPRQPGRPANLYIWDDVVTAQVHEAGESAS